MKGSVYSAIPMDTETNNGLSASVRSWRDRIQRDRRHDSLDEGKPCRFGIAHYRKQKVTQFFRPTRSGRAARSHSVTPAAWALD